MTKRISFIELGNDPLPQLHNLKNDLAEGINVAAGNQATLEELKDLFQKIKENRNNMKK